MLCRLCVFIGAGERYNKMEMIVRYLTGRLRYCHCLPAPLRLAPNVSGRRQSRTEGCEREWWQGRMSQSDLSNSSPAPPPGYREGPHPVISDPLFSLIIFLYVSVIFLYMFFAFCWYDGMPIATFSSYSERGAKARRKRTYAKFVYPYPDDLHSTRNKVETLKDKTLPSEDEDEDKISEEKV